MLQNQAGSQPNLHLSISQTDPIADMLSRIRNAIAVNKDEVMIPSSKMKLAIAQQLVKSGFVNNVAETKLGIGKMLKVTIKSPLENAKITEIQRISKPGRRQYVKSKDIPTIKRGRGIIIVSTSKGLMTDSEARKSGLGGELICKVY